MQLYCTYWSWFHQQQFHWHCVGLKNDMHFITRDQWIPSPNRSSSQPCSSRGCGLGAYMVTSFGPCHCSRTSYAAEVLWYPQPTCICGYWVLCLWDHGCAVRRWVPLPPVVHQHQVHGRGQARSEQEVVHAEHDEVSWVYRNGAIHAGGILVPCVCLHCPSRISSACNAGCSPVLIHPLHCKHSTPSPSMS